MKTLLKPFCLTNTAALLTLLTGLHTVTVQGADAPAKPATLKAEIIVNRDKYELDPATSGDEFFKKASDPKRRERLPAPPKIDLVFRISNSGDADRTLNIGGDESRVTLQLDGPGTLNLNPGLATTMEFRMGAPVIIKAGAHYDIPIKSLASGARNMGQYSYWTKAGELTLKATFTGNQGGKQLKLETEPVKLKVVEATPPPNVVPPK